MKIAIVGAGAMGSLFAALLIDAGEAVTLLETNQTRRERVSRDGLRLRLPDRVVEVEAPVFDPVDFKPPQDLLIITTKAPAARGALAATAELAGKGAFVLSLQNGLGAAEAFEGLLPPERILIGVTDRAAEFEEGWLVSPASGEIRFGAMGTENGPGIIAAMDAIRDTFIRAGVATHCDADVRVVIWEKLAFNAAFNAVATVTGLPVRGLDNGSGRALVLGAARETVAVAAAQGIEVCPARVFDKIESAFREQSGHLPSMLQDRRAGRPTEIEAINGAVVRLGDRLGVAVDINRTLTDLVRLTGG